MRYPPLLGYLDIAVESRAVKCLARTEYRFIGSTGILPADGVHGPFGQYGNARTPAWQQSIEAL